jgi:glycosyltransferase involved in cell wall biosynthesis
VEQAAAAHQQLQRLRAWVFADEAPVVATPTRDSGAARRHVDRYLREVEPDLIHVEGHYLLDLLPASKLARTVLVEHNVESELLRQQAETTAIPSHQEAEMLAEVRRRERRAWTAAARVAALTVEDCARIRQAAPAAAVRCSPNGADHLPPLGAVPVPPNWLREPRLLFVANFAYPPNQDAALWAIREILPRVVAVVPTVRLALAGPDLTGEALDAALGSPAVDVLGWVPRVEEQLDRADVVVCPLRIGGGVNVKVLEAARRGCAVVTTPIGVEGLPATLREAIAVAPDAEGLAQHTARLLSDPALRARVRASIARAARHLPTWDEAAECLLAIWDEVADQARGWP